MDQEPPAVLMKHPRMLVALWNEWQNGVAGSKPAREFPRQEKGRVKFKYSNRLIVWKCIERLLDRGNNLSTAFSKIRRVYGGVTITVLIKKMRRDKRNGGHASLR